ncbi:branched-chain amino acid ABC transporter ATP-binding protein/permease [Skermanella mucosa]|uniref:branched-chain amino acid ABC transporter ATP-binding protein/permease n=1 Tax=Skermanella mucosa TaxID=1789672 RepID=UPI00192B0BDC|nr:branched-chain amino acid ABC transporter ATP-binding protein/permease [Skermanella mucosa]UEM21605.1 branched-chain amino acid ABC transporter ATP-binding protein/permease [Skermanella mucosa]
MPLLAAAGAALAAYALLVADPYGLRVLTVAGVYALAVIGYQMIFGNAGALSLAQGTFYGIGAYATGILGSRYGLGFEATFPLSILAPALLALAVAAPVLRLESHYFALATLGIGQVVLLAAVEWQGLTGGSNGIAGVPGVELFGWRPGRGLPLALFVWTLVALGALAAWRIGRGLRGLAFPLMRDTPAAARTLGIDIDRLRLECFVLGAAYAGAAGALAAHIQRVVSPEVLEFPVMVTILTMAVIGGLGRVAGALAGAVLLTQLPEWFRWMEGGYLLLYGVALLATVVAAPWGLVGLAERLRARWLPEPPRPPPAPLAPEPRPAAPFRGPVLYVEGFSKSFGGVRAVHGVSLAIDPGEILGVIGPNGSGKTTLINLVTGLEKPDGGRLYVRGVELTGRAPHGIAGAGVARTFQTASLPPGVDALGAVAAARITLDGDVRTAEAHAMHFLERVLERAGAADLAREPCATLPPGLRRRVELARALARQPAVLLLDEPAAGLTEAEQAGLARLLRAAADDGAAVLIVEHNMPFLLPLADRITCLDEGGVIAEGTPDAIRRDPRVRAAYLGSPGPEAP